MEPIEFALVAIAIPFLSKYVEKPGEKLGEHTTKQLAKLWNSIRALPENTFVALRPLQKNPFPEDFELAIREMEMVANQNPGCLLYTSPSPRDMRRSRMPSSA